MTLELHKALHLFRPVTEHYASVPFAEAFNWDEITLPEDIERDWFAVVIYSKQQDGSNAGRKYGTLIIVPPNSDKRTR